MKKFSFVMLFVLSVMCIYAEKNLAVAAFDVVGNAVTKEEAEAITELYITELVATGKVSVVDRTNFEKILKEMKFQSSDWSDSDKTAELGRAVNADIIARGQIIKLGSKMYLSATIIDVKSAKVLSSARKEFNSIDDVFGLLTNFAEQAMEGLSIKIGDVGPGGGIVFYIEGQNVYECVTNIGTASWSSAKYMASSYSGGGYRDWHLPTIGELRLMYSNLFERGLIKTYGRYWSCNTYESSSYGTNPISKNFYSNSWDEFKYDESSHNYIVSAVRFFTQD